MTSACRKKAGKEIIWRHTKSILIQFQGVCCPALTIRVIQNYICVVWKYIEYGFAENGTGSGQHKVSIDIKLDRGPNCRFTRKEITMKRLTAKEIEQNKIDMEICRLLAKIRSLKSVILKTKASMLRS